jgi:hypothetical protein
MPNGRVITNSKTRPPRFDFSLSGERANCSLRWQPRLSGSRTASEGRSQDRAIKRRNRLSR